MEKYLKSTLEDLISGLNSESIHSDDASTLVKFLENDSRKRHKVIKLSGGIKKSQKSLASSADDCLSQRINESRLKPTLSSYTNRYSIKLKTNSKGLAVTKRSIAPQFGDQLIDEGNSINPQAIDLQTPLEKVQISLVNKRVNEGEYRKSPIKIKLRKPKSTAK